MPKLKYLNLFHRKVKAYHKTIKKIYKQKTTHSRVVFLLKIALPSIVALFLSIIILAPELNEIKNIKIDIPTLESSDKISFTMDKGAFYGQGSDGMTFSLNVDKFQENRVDNLILLSKITGKLFLKNSNWIDLKSDNGTYIKKDNNLILDGNIYLIDNQNNEVFTDSAVVNLDNNSVKGDKPIMANTNFGTIVGEGFDFKQYEKYNFLGKVNAVIDMDKL